MAEHVCFGCHCHWNDDTDVHTATKTRHVQVGQRQGHQAERPGHQEVQPGAQFIPRDAAVDIRRLVLNGFCLILSVNTFILYLV